MGRILLMALTATLFAAAGEAAEPSRPLDLMHQLGCKGCHRIGGEGGTLGPPLEQLGSKLSRQNFIRQLTEPRARSPQGLMPSYDYLTPEELNRLADFFLHSK